MILLEKILFNEEECHKIIEHSEKSQRIWNKNDRRYKSSSIIYSSETDWIFHKLKDFFESETGFKIKDLKREIHFHNFTQGDWFKKHNDNKSNRLYAVGTLLNDKFEGGDFNFYNPEKISLLKKEGNTYIFDVRIEHEIMPIDNGIRYSLLWFLEADHLKINHSRLI